MRIRYNDNKTATINMKECLDEAIEESGLNIVRTAATPAKRDLFEINESSTPLDKRRAKISHSVSAKLLYVSIRARMDLLLATGFLCTRVSKSIVDDEQKLKRLLEYVKGTLNDDYTIGADMGRFCTSVNASYAVHSDMKSHTGGAISFGTGGII
jgi:hypothetical protein